MEILQIKQYEHSDKFIIKNFSEEELAIGKRIRINYWVVATKYSVAISDGTMETDVLTNSLNIKEIEDYITKEIQGDSILGTCGYPYKAKINNFSFIDEGDLNELI